MDMSEQGAALVLVAGMCIICGPFYLAFLVTGILRRKELIKSPIAKFIYIISFPLALAFTGLVHVYGTDEINVSSPNGSLLYNLAYVSLGAGALAAIYIIVASIRAQRAAKQAKGIR